MCLLCTSIVVIVVLLPPARGAWIPTPTTTPSDTTTPQGPHRRARTHRGGDGVGLGRLVAVLSGDARALPGAFVCLLVYMCGGGWIDRLINPSHSCIHRSAEQAVLKEDKAAVPALCLGRRQLNPFVYVYVGIYSTLYATSDIHPSTLTHNPLHRLGDPPH